MNIEDQLSLPDDVTIDTGDKDGLKENDGKGEGDLNNQSLLDEGNGTPEWYDTAKYGDFTPENVAKQAADYKNAVKGMNTSQQEAAILRKENVSLQRQPAEETKQDRVLSEWEIQEQRDKLSNEMGMPFEQIQGIRDIISLELGTALAPLKDALFSSQSENSLKSIKDNPIFKEYEGEIKAELEKLPAEKRAAPGAMTKILKDVLFANQDSIFNQIKENAILAVHGDPAKPPGTESGTERKPEEQVKITLTPAEEAYCRRYNLDPKEVIGTKESREKTKETGYGKYLESK